MPTYALLANPGHNRVYFAASKSLALAELSVALGITNAVGTEIAGLYYVTFYQDSPLSDDYVALISRLSFVYALYEWRGDALYPIALSQEQYLDESVSSILKYSGKTNELFTRMMINIASMTYDKGAVILKIFDPVAGKGTTLFEGLIRGYDAYGVEIGEKAVMDGYNHLKRFLETARVKHAQDNGKINGYPRHAFSITRTKGEPARRFEVVAANSMNADRIYKKNFFDLIIGDLPYGVKHGAVTQEKQSSLTRNPGELLTAGLPAWNAVLKPGGVIALSYNQNVLKREKVLSLLTAAGFSVYDDNAYRQFSHAVDQSILRDLVVARK